MSDEFTTFKEFIHIKKKIRYESSYVSISYCIFLYVLYEMAG